MCSQEKCATSREALEKALAPAEVPLPVLVITAAAAVAAGLAVAIRTAAVLATTAVEVPAGAYTSTVVLLLTWHLMCHPTRQVKLKSSLQESREEGHEPATQLTSGKLPVPPVGIPCGSPRGLIAVMD